MKPTGNRRKLQTAVFFGLFITVVGAGFIAILLLVGQIFWMGKEIDEITWQLPATIYAEPPTISSGRIASSSWLVQYLKRLNYVESSSPRVQPGQYAHVRNGIVFRAKPHGSEETNAITVTFGNGRIRSVVDSSTNMRLDYLALEPTPLATLFGSEWEKRTLVKLEHLPKHVIEAVTSIEDRRFYKHSGVDIVSIGRAVINNLSEDGLFQGGSTITQQLVKNLYLTPEKTVRRKVNEAMMAVMMEGKYNKKEILEFYLNEVYLGQRGSISIKGIGEASQLYFKKDASLLTIPEAAMIAGLIQAPSRYDPYKHPEKAKLRRNSVLLAMQETGALTQEECDRYMKSSLAVKEPDERLNRAPYFLTYVKKQLKEQFSSRALHQEDYRIISTLDYDMQLAAQQALTEGLARIDKIRGRRVGPVQGSLIAIEASTGKIRAFVGGRNFYGSQFDRLTQARRQPGSSFKPFVYAAALETAFESNNRFYTTSSLVEDEPWSLQIDKAVWQPRNYNGSYNGVVSLRTALAKSMNIATAKIAHDIGFYKVFQVARRMGFENVKPYPSIALGAFEVSPYQLIRAYSAFANGGKMVDLQAISRVVNSEGDMLRERDVRHTTALRPETAYLITDMLKTVMRSGTGVSAQRYGIRQTIAGKTGTTNDQKDAWFVGYTPDFICLVWVGYDDNTPVRMTGAQAALPIWATFMKKIENRIPVREFPRPHGIVEKMIDPYTGQLASYSCPAAVREVFIKGTEPLRPCSESDHYLPVEYFLGPEPRIQQAHFNDPYYTGENYANISYDYDQFMYTNYNEQESQTPEMVDYSDTSFPDQAEEAENTDSDYGSSVVGDYEAPNAGWNQNEGYTVDTTRDISSAPVYLAPKPKKKVPIYTNDDIPESVTDDPAVASEFEVHEEDDDNDDDDDEQ